MNKLKKQGRVVIRWGLMVGMLCMTAACAHRQGSLAPRKMRPPDQIKHMEVTGYCPCGICCNWKRSWWRLGKPVIASGPQKGQAKEVGRTASGKMAKRGTVAADTRLLPMGTILHVPGYGYGRVEDRGSAIKGNRLDLYFNTHKEALNWGRKQVEVRIWHR